jgi:D-beta-D-heptose 7-phosphate kinase/D-beta-D-heptose 1-phosphate adenosyltransferase
MDIVWVNGCFDILHLGHIEMLKFARGLGDALYVGIDSDVRISENKGSNRPFQNQETRMAVLDSLKFVDNVSIFDTTHQLREYVRNASPKFLVVGEEYKDKEVVGAEYAENIIFFPRIENISTTLTLKKIESSL